MRGKDGAEVLLAFDARRRRRSSAALEAVGEMPLPPYIAARRAAGRRRPRGLPDRLRRPPGRGGGADRGAALRRGACSPASPPAASAETRLTLHVGAGTFLPVKVEDIEEHRMHAEWGEIGPAAAEAVARHARRRAAG